MLSRQPSSGQSPDARVVLRAAHGDALAACSLWWRHTPRWQGRAVGFFGHYEAQDSDNAAHLLDNACTMLAARGCATVIGPVDGSTWLRYRCVVESGGEPPFFLEPQNPPEWPQQFRAAGFEPFAFYRSAVQEDLRAESPRILRADARLRDAGVRIRALDTRRIDEELKRIHALSLESFANGLLFSPVGYDAFAAQYRPLLPHVNTDLVMLAEHDGRLVGYLFALPDALQATRARNARTVIVKTVAVASGRRYAGLGHVLAMHAARRARALGFTRAIHALMHEANGSASWSAGLGRPFRRYALFARSLDDSCRDKDERPHCSNPVKKVSRALFRDRPRGAFRPPL